MAAGVNVSPDFLSFGSLRDAARLTATVVDANDRLIDPVQEGSGRFSGT